MSCLFVQCGDTRIWPRCLKTFIFLNSKIQYRCIESLYTNKDIHSTHPPAGHLCSEQSLHEPSSSLVLPLGQEQTNPPIVFLQSSSLGQGRYRQSLTSAGDTKFHKHTRYRLRSQLSKVWTHLYTCYPPVPGSLYYRHKYLSSCYNHAHSSYWSQHHRGYSVNHPVMDLWQLWEKPRDSVTS